MEIQPISKKQEVRFMGPTSSEDFNEWGDSIYYDQIQLFNLGNSNKDNIIKNMDMLVRTNYFLENKVKELEDTLAGLTSTLAGLSVDPTVAKKVLTTSFSNSNNIVNLPPTDTSPQLVVDNKFGILHLPIQDNKKISKVYLTNDSGEIFLPKTLKIRLYEDIAPISITGASISAPLIASEEFDMSNDDNQKNGPIASAFSGNPKTFWTRTVEQETTVDAVYAVIEVDLPQNIINHTRVNSIFLDPSPEFSFSIMDIRYLDVDTWTTLQSFPRQQVDPNLPQEMQSVGTAAFFFESQSILKLRFYIKQNKFFNENSKRVFTYGFKSIEVFYTRFLEEKASTLLRFDIPDPVTQEFGKIDSINPVFMEGGVEDQSLITTSAFRDQNEDVPISLGSTLPIGTKTIYVKVSLDTRKDSGLSPALSKVSITYTTN